MIEIFKKAQFYLIPIFLFLLVIFEVVFLSFRNKAKDEFSIKNFKRENCYSETISGEVNDMKYSITFPKTNNKQIDSLIHGIVYEKIDNFISKESPEKTLKGTFQSFHFDKENLSIQLIYCEKANKKDPQNETSETFIFENSKLINKAKIFNPKKTNLVIDSIKKALLENENYKKIIEKENLNLDEIFNNNLKNPLKNVVIDENDFTFFYDAGEILPNKFGIVAATVPSNQIEESFSVNAPSPFGKSVKSTTTSKPVIALTFDDGPMKENTEQILDELKKYDAHATFFVVGKNAAQNPAILQREIEEGHEIGNHSYSHPILTKLTPEKIKNEIEKTNEIIKSITKTTPTLVRPPGGSQNKKVKENVKYPLILWSIDTKDWKTKNTKKTIETVLNEAHDGQIVLMHDIQNSTVEAVKTIIPQLIEKGFDLVTVSELFNQKNIDAQIGNVYSKAA